jgi:hypothetical protein
MSNLPTRAFISMWGFCFLAIALHQSGLDISALFSAALAVCLGVIDVMAYLAERTAPPYTGENPGSTD